MQTSPWGWTALALVVVVGGAHVARAQDAETPDLLDAATPNAGRAIESAPILEHRYRIRVRRTRMYGGLMATGVVMGLVGAGGAIRTYCLGCDDDYRSEALRTLGRYASDIGIAVHGDRKGGTGIILGAFGIAACGQPRWFFNALAGTIGE